MLVQGRACGKLGSTAALPPRRVSPPRDAGSPAGWDAWGCSALACLRDALGVGSGLSSDGNEEEESCHSIPRAALQTAHPESSSASQTVPSWVLPFISGVHGAGDSDLLLLAAIFSPAA